MIAFDFLVPSDVVCDYWVRGYAVLRGVLDADAVASLATSLDEGSPNARALLDELGSSRLLARIACDVLGTRAVRRLGSATLSNERRGRPWHQDALAWHVAGERACIVRIPLDRALAATTFARSSHLSAALRAQTPLIGRGKRRLLWHTALLLLLGLPVERTACSAGDLTIHHGWTLHAADPSVEATRWLVVHYVDADAPYAPPRTRRRPRLAERLGFAAALPYEPLPDALAPVAYERPLDALSLRRTAPG